MKHINLTNWRGSITDWTKLNYIYGGLDDSYALKGNLRIDKDNYNYVEFRESKNLAYERVKTIDYGAKHVQIRIGTYPAGTYYIKVSGGIAFLYVGSVQTLNIQNGGTFTLTAESILYIDWYGYSDDYTIMLNNGSSALPYEPYFTGKKYVITENLGIVDLGTLTYTLTGTGQNTRFRTIISDIAGQVNTSTPIIAYSKIYTAVTYLSARADMTMYYDQNTVGTQSVGFKNDSYDDATVFKTAMSGVMLTYKLKDPVIEVVE